MNFLRQLFKWFLTGSTETIEVEAATDASERSSTEEAIPVSPKKKKKSYEIIDFDLDRGANVNQFLEDIRSIEPVTKQFSKAKDDLLNELKKLSHRKA